MKNTMRLAGIIALVAVIGFSFAACNNGTTNGGEGGGSTAASPSGTYFLDMGDYMDFAMRITFSGSSFTMFTAGQSLSGTCSVAGSTVILRNNGEIIYSMTIVDANTLLDGEGLYWRKG